MDRQRCGRCKVNLPLDRFKVKRCGNRQKRCMECNAKAAAQRAANKCEHGRRRQQCRECGGVSICEHGRQRAHCRECGGTNICEHGRQRAKCRECGGSQSCEHGRERNICRECGGSGICEHGRRRCMCRECGGSQICRHGRRRRQCHECDPCGHLRHIVTNRIHVALKVNKDSGSLEYLGCSIVEFKAHIEAQFEPGMTWENHGQAKVDGPRVWQIDHIVPIKFEETPGVPQTLEEVAARLHWTNCQPMWAEDNIAKGNRYVGRATPEAAPAQAAEPAPWLKLTDADIDELFADLGI